VAKINTRETDRIALVNEVIPMDEFERAVNDLAKKLAAGPPKSISLIKNSPLGAAIGFKNGFRIGISGSGKQKIIGRACRLSKKREN
jgi:hypothetical protein